jgi:hypothetical protein
MAQIESSESVSQLLISAVHHQSNGWRGWLRPGQRGLMLTVARHGRARRLVGVWVLSSYGGRFLMRFAPTGSQRWGELDYANFNWRRAATEPGNGEAARPVLGDAEGGLRWSFNSKDVTEASLNSLLASRPTNSTERRWKTRIWWLPRVQRVLDLRPKIHTICSAIYRGF